MADLRNLSAGLLNAEQQLLATVGRATVKIVADMAIRVAGETPVDTSVAQTNWTINTSPHTAEYFPFAPTADNTRGDKRGRGYSAAVSRIRQDERQIRSKVVRGNKIRSVYIHNHAPYIGLLDEGSSPQAGAGFVEQNLTNAFERGITDASAILAESGVTFA